ncbi:MAG: methyltransferase domain-containing protein, partial [Anaerolineae bacterium]|nr:methyltransferase domain-containing protein [Anaerolineae bacterium]
GNLAMHWLSRRNATSTIATLSRLDATLEQVAANFRCRRGDVHRTIDPRDGRMAAVRQWCAGIDAGAQVADVGCGAGRFLARLAAERPSLRLSGIDAAATPSVPLPHGVAYAQRRVLNLASDGRTFDAAFAVDVLQHTLLPAQAVAEICRVVRSGGRILLIDKDRRHQSRSEHAPWERWFTADEVSRWLAEFCDDVSVREVSHGTAPPQHGLYLCWTAVRRKAAARLAA